MIASVPIASEHWLLQDLHHILKSVWEWVASVPGLPVGGRLEIGIVTFDCLLSLLEKAGSVDTARTIVFISILFTLIVKLYFKNLFNSPYKQLFAKLARLFCQSLPPKMHN